MDTTIEQATTCHTSDAAVSDRAHLDEHTQERDTDSTEANHEECVTPIDNSINNSCNHTMPEEDEKFVRSNTAPTETVGSCNAACTEDDGYVAATPEYASMSTCHEQYTTEHNSSSSAIEPCKSPSSESMEESAGDQEEPRPEEMEDGIVLAEPTTITNNNKNDNNNNNTNESDRNEGSVVCSVSRNLNSRVDPELDALQDWKNVHDDTNGNMDQHTEVFLISTSCGGRENEQHVPLQPSYQVYPHPSHAHSRSRHSNNMDMGVNVSNDMHAHVPPHRGANNNEGEAENVQVSHGAAAAAAVASDSGGFARDEDELAAAEEEDYYRKDEHVVLNTEQTSQSMSRGDGVHTQQHQKQQQQQQHMELHDLCREKTERTDNTTMVSEHSTTTATTSAHPHRHLNPDELSRLHTSSSKGKTPPVSHVSVSNTNNSCHRILSKEEIDHMMAIKQQQQQQQQPQSSTSTASGGDMTAVDEHPRRRTESQSDAQRSVAPCASDGPAAPHNTQHRSVASKAANTALDGNGKKSASRVYSASSMATSLAATASAAVKSNNNNNNNNRGGDTTTTTTGTGDVCHANSTTQSHQNTSNSKRLSRRQQQHQQRQQDNTSTNSFNAKVSVEHASHQSRNPTSGAPVHAYMSPQGGIQRTEHKSNSAGDGVGGMCASYMQQNSRSSAEYNNSDSNQDRTNAYSTQGQPYGHINNVTHAGTGNPPSLATLASNMPFRYPQSHYSQQQGGRDRVASSAPFYGSFYNDQQQQHLHRSPYNTLSDFYAPQNLSVSQQNGGNYANNSNIGNTNNNDILPGGCDHARHYHNNNSIPCDNYNNGSHGGHMNSCTSFQCRGPTAGAGARNDYNYAMPSNASWMHGNMGSYGRQPRGYNRSYQGADGTDERNNNVHNSWNNNARNNNKNYKGANNHNNNNCVNSMNSNNNNNNMFAIDNPPVDSSMMSPQYNQWKQYSDYMAYCHQIFQQQLYQQQQQQNFLKNMVIFATGMKDEGVPNPSSPAAVAAAAASIAVGGGANANMNSTVPPNMFGDRLPPHPPMVHGGGNGNDHTAPHANACNNGGWNVMNDNDNNHVNTGNMNTHGNGNFFRKNADSQSMEKNVGAKGKSRRYPSNQLRSSHDNTPQNKKYSQCDPFSMYKHNKTLEHEVTHLEQEVK